MARKWTIKESVSHIRVSLNIYETNTVPLINFKCQHIRTDEEQRQKRLIRFKNEVSGAIATLIHLKRHEESSQINVLKQRKSSSISKNISSNPRYQSIQIFHVVSGAIATLRHLKSHEESLSQIIVLKLRKSCSNSRNVSGYL